MKGFKKIGIIGLGLMGGSIAKALKEKNIPIATEGSLEGSDLVVIATPLSTILPIAKSVKAPLIMDIGSIKEEIAASFEELTEEGREFVATHPMAGSEKSGYENSRSDLFLGAPWVVTPHSKNSEGALEKIRAFIELLGGVPLRMDPKSHDRRMALLSQLPHLLSVALFDFVQGKDPACLEMAGPGFKSMTRLVQDNPVMRKEMASYNEAALKECIKDFYDYFTLRHQCN